MSSASDLSCHHQSGCFALADDQTGGLLSKICHHQNPLQLPKCLFPRSASCKHFISSLRHPILSAPEFPEGGINPLDRRFHAVNGNIWAIRWHFWLLHANAPLPRGAQGGSFHPMFWLVLGLLTGAVSNAQPQQGQWLCDDSSLSRREFYVVLTQTITTDVRWSVQTGAGFHIWKWRQSSITAAGLKTKVRRKPKPADPTRCRGNEATLGRGAGGSLGPNKKPPCAGMSLLSFEALPQRVQISWNINEKRGKRREPSSAPGVEDLLGVSHQS